MVPLAQAYAYGVPRVVQLAHPRKRGCHRTTIHPLPVPVLPAKPSPRVNKPHGGFCVSIRSTLTALEASTMRTTKNPFLIALGLLAFFAIPIILIATAIVAIISGYYIHALLPILILGVLVAQERNAFARNFPKENSRDEPET